MTDYNAMEMNVQLTRKDVCDLLLACVNAMYSANDGGKKWEKLHEKLHEQLEQFDKENGF